MSKSQKQGTCKHKFVQGAKKGKLCKKPCRGKFCFSHSKKTQITKKKYYTEQKIKDEDYQLYQKIKTIKEAKTIDDLPDSIKLDEKFRNLKLKDEEILKKIIGIRIFLGYNESKYVDEENILFEKTFDDIIEELDDPEDPKNEEKLEVLRRHLIKVMPRGKLPYFEFIGNKTKAKNKLKKLDIEKELIKKKIEKIDKILSAISLRVKQLKHQNSYHRTTPQERYYNKNQKEILKQKKEYNKSIQSKKNANLLARENNDKVPYPEIEVIKKKQNNKNALAQKELILRKYYNENIDDEIKKATSSITRRRKQQMDLQLKFNDPDGDEIIKI